MSYKKVPTFVIVIMLTISCSETKSTKAVTTPEANQIIDQWLDLWKTYDINSLENIFWDDPDCTYFSSEKEGIIKGFDALTPHHEGFGFVKGGKTPTNSLWLEEQNTFLLNSNCVVTAIWYFGDKSAPRDSIQNGPVTFVLVRDDNDQVKIGHTHFANY